MKIAVVVLTILTQASITNAQPNAHDNESFVLPQPCNDKIISAVQERWSQVAHETLNPKEAPIVLVCPMVCEDDNCTSRIFVEEKTLMGQENYLYHVSNYFVSTTDHKVNNLGSVDCEIKNISGINLKNLASAVDRERNTYLILSSDYLDRRNPKFISPSTAYYGVNPCRITQTVRK